jgi:hypothetical protein
MSKPSNTMSRIGRVKTAILTGLLFLACKGTTPDAASVEYLPHGASLGQSVAQLRTARPSVVYAPYGGWHEELRGGDIFREASYQFTEETLGERESTSGSLWAVSLVADSTTSAEVVIRRLSAAYGRTAVGGCAAVPPDKNMQELVFLTWPHAPLLVAISFMVDSKAMVGTPVLHVATDKSKLQQLSGIPLREECRFQATVQSLIAHVD